MGKNTCCSTTGPEFISQLPHGSSQLFVILVPEGSMPSGQASVSTKHSHGTLTYMQANSPLKIRLKLTLYFQELLKVQH